MEQTAQALAIWALLRRRSKVKEDWVADSWAFSEDIERCQVSFDAHSY